jgi:predicted MFS family arabinose efflux permease
MERERRAGLTLADAARGHRFWILLLSILCAYMGFSGIGTNLYPSMIDRGMDEDQASTVQSAFGIAIIVGRVVVGGLVDRFWAPGVAAVALALPVGGALLFTTDPGFALAICGALLIGFAAGAELDLMSFLAARYFGLAHYAKIYSILYAALAVCSGTAPMLFARVHDSTGSYDLGFTAAAVLFALAVGLVLTLGRYPEHEEQDP